MWQVRVLLPPIRLRICLPIFTVAKGVDLLVRIKLAGCGTQDLGSHVRLWLLGYRRSGMHRHRSIGGMALAYGVGTRHRAHSGSTVLIMLVTVMVMVVMGMTMLMIWVVM